MDLYSSFKGECEQDRRELDDTDISQVNADDMEFELM